jgi:hypothetical protein
MLWSLISTIARLLIFFSIPIVIIVYFAKFGFSHIYDVELGTHEIKVLIFKKFPIWRLPVDAVERAYDRDTFLSVNGLIVSMFLVFPAAVNRFPRSPNPIIVQRRSGFPKYLSMTPASPQDFLRELNKYLDDTRRSL